MNNINLSHILTKISKFPTSLASMVGIEDGLGPRVDSSIKSLLDDLERDNKGAVSLSKYLSYKYYDEDSNLFFNEDGICGFIFELAPIVGSDETLTKNLELFFNDEMPYNCWLQFTLVASNDVRDNIARWKGARVSNNSALKMLEESREKFLNKLANNYKSSQGRIARDYRLYVNCCQKIEDGEFGIKKFKSFMQNFKQKLDSINLAPRVCGVDDLLKLVREIVEVDLVAEAGKNLQKAKRYDKHRSIADQVLTPGTLHKVCEDRIDHYSTNLTTKSYMASDLPVEFSLNQMIGLLGDDTRDNLAIPGRFILTYIVASNLNKGMQAGIIQKGERAIHASEQWYSRNDRDIKREASEWKDINDRVRNGERFLTEYFGVSLTCPSDFIEEAEQSLFSLYNIMNWRLEVIKYFQLPLLLSVLPMQGVNLWPYLNNFKLTRCAISSESIAKLPIHSEWKGVPEPAVMLIGRRGQLFHFNPFYRISSGNYNMCVFGPSGSGKSVFLQELATSIMAQNAKVFILDIGQSFKNICELLGGEIIQFGRDSKIVLNPFAGLKSGMGEEEMLVAKAYAKAIVCTMTASKGDALKESMIEKAISRGLAKYKGTAECLDISKLADLLIELGREDGNGEVASNLSLSLFSYGKDGIYGRFFDAGERINPNDLSCQRNDKPKQTEEISFDKQITVFEFEEIKTDPLFLSVILQIISMQIFMQVLTGDRSRKFMLIVDEAWMILDYSAKFLAEIARTIRKYGGSLVVCVQNFNDLQNGEHHRAILENSTWTVLLKQDEKGIDSFKNSEGFKDKIPLIKSISISPGQYAEVLLCSTGISVVGRLALDPYSSILYSTDADVFRGINELKAAGYGVEEAVKIIAERKYGTL